MSSSDLSSSKEKFEFPECWSSDLRMSALFAPFRSKSLNPTDWNSKMKFWTNLIESWCKHHKRPVIEISSLKNSFSRKGLVPACLDEVVQHMTSTGILVPKESFMAEDETWRSWAGKVLVTNPLKWTFNTVKSTIIRNNTQTEVYYVHVPVVKSLSEELTKKVLSSSTEKIVNIEDLFKFGIENSEDLWLILRWQERQGVIAISRGKEQTLVKFSRNKEKLVKISDVDLGVYSLEKLEKVLQETIQKLETERSAALEETRRHLREKMKNMAKITLRRKNEIEKTIEKRATTLENIQGILLKIEGAKLESEIFESYQKGMDTLKQVFRETGLDADNVTKTMDELKAVLDGRKEVEEALSRPMDPSLAEDLEEELSELLLQDAPEVPEDPVSLPREKTKKKEKEEEESRKRLEALAL